MKCIVLRVHGLTYRQIGESLGKSAHHVSVEIGRVYRKTGIKSDLASLTLWALAWGFDTPLGEETSAERPYPGKPKPRRKRVRWPLQDQRRTLKD